MLLYFKTEIGSSKGHFFLEVLSWVAYFLFPIQHEVSAAFNKIKVKKISSFSLMFPVDDWKKGSN